MVRRINKLNNFATTSVLNMLYLTLYKTDMVTQSISVANVIQPASYNMSNETVVCREAYLMNMTFPICIYTAVDDSPLSAFLLQRRTYFEASEISRCLQLLRLDRRLQLVDIGANVGFWSLPAARMTNVLSVEPNWRSMSRLAKAVNLGSVSSNITLIHNAISNVRTTLNMGVQPTNQGDAFLIYTSKCKKAHCNTLPPIKTILLNDLLPLMRSRAAILKVDVQGNEVNVFTDTSAGRFFDYVNVPLVFIEWLLCKRHSPKVVKRLINFFYSRNYTAFKLDNSKVKKHYLSWPANMLFKKPPYVRF